MDTARIVLRPAMLAAAAVLVFAAAGVSCAEAKSTPVDVYILAGQSNAYGPVRPFATTTADTKIFYMYHVGTKDTHGADGQKNVADTGGDILTLQPTPSPIGLRSGPEINFARKMYALYQAKGVGRDIVVLKFAIGASSLNRQWFDNGVFRYEDQFDAFLQRSIANLQQAGMEPEFKGLLFLQGESDTYSMDDARAYQKHLEDLLVRVRATTNNPQLPFVVARIDPDFPETATAKLQAKAKIRMAQMQVANAGPQGAWITLDDLQHTAPNAEGISFHFTVPEYDIIGFRFYSKMQSLLGLQPK